jgi:predicted nucleotidyltransferase
LVRTYVVYHPGLGKLQAPAAIVAFALRDRKQHERQFYADMGTHEHPLVAVRDAVNIVGMRTLDLAEDADPFGSVARGHAGEGSDVDVLVSLAEERPMYLSYLAVRLTRALRRDVDVLSLKHVRAHEPALLGAILRAGRPVVDRDGSWPALIAKRRDVERAAAKARAERHSRAAHAVAQLIGG